MSYEPTEWKSGDVVTSAKLNKMEQGISEAGSGLPAVTSDDNGDVLAVVEGEWAKAAPSGSNVVILDETAMQTKTYNDYIAYANAGKIIFVLFTGTGEGTNIPYFVVVTITGANYDNVGEQYIVKGSGLDIGGVAYTLSLTASTATEAMTPVWD